MGGLAGGAGAAAPPPLIPPFRLALVEAGVYRGAYPSLKNARYLARAGLASVVSLVPGGGGGAGARDLAALCAGTGARHVSFAVAKYDDGFSHTAGLVAAVLGHVLDPRNHPVLLHCLDGRENTGIVVMCLRKLQNWGLQAILSEFARYTKGRSFTFAQQQFVQSFATPVPLPPQVPHWFAARVHAGPAPVAPAVAAEADPPPVDPPAFAPRIRFVEGGALPPATRTRSAPAGFARGEEQG